MKRLSDYLLFVGLIMAAVSICSALAYHFTPLDLTTSEKLNLTVLYCVGTAMSISAAGYKIFKEPK
ncbi:hypothetical protein [Dickeya phage Coodle]|uniref:Holin n=2 Tax=Limestonevirus limestone TaxID=1091052 RepID=A0A248H2S7_9CAUD|nr:hypothetical protein [Dickeya phage XF4]AYN55564.1 hypothetical protein [Dickeya phage Coodle]